MPQKSMRNRCAPLLKNLESEHESFCDNDEERECYESPSKHGRLKEPVFNKNDDTEKLDSIGMLLSANESANDRVSKKTLEHSDSMKQRSALRDRNNMRKFNEKVLSARK